MTVMTLNEISHKLVKNNFKQYGLFFFSILFSITMIGAYGVLQYSPTVTNVLVDGGSTQTISQAMFFGSMLGIIVFQIYADTLFLQYKSREIGVFLSLGIDRRSVRKIVVKEYTLLFQLAALFGLLLSVPAAYLCWSLLNIFLETQETAFEIGWIGLAIAIGFAIFCWIVLRIVNCKYIQSVDIIKILKMCDENDEATNGKSLLLILGFLIVPVGIAAFFTFQNMTGILYSALAYIGLIAAVWGVYILIIQLASIGDMLKKINTKTYYKNIVFYNLLKQRIRQYTRSIFAATLLIVFTVFGIGFSSIGFIDGYYASMNDPYDYTINATYEPSGITKDHILSVAEQTGTNITQIKVLNGLLVGVQNSYRSGETDWSSRIIVSQNNFNTLAKTDITVPIGSYTLYHDSSMSYKRNSFCGNSSIFYNPTTKEEFNLSQNTPVCFDGLFNSKSFFSSFLILNDTDFEQFSATVSGQYRVQSYMLKVEDWKNTTNFQNAILQEVILKTDGQIFENWHNSATFDKTGGSPRYFLYKGNETRTVRLWALYPLSKLSSTTTQIEAFATYIMLMLFIAIIAFVSSIMVIGLKLLSTIWSDAVVYDNLQKLGMTQNKIKQLITKQMVFIYFIPTFLGCAIGAFTTYRIMLVSAVSYIGKVMILVGGLCSLVLALQIAMFFLLRHKVMQEYV